MLAKGWGMVIREYTKNKNIPIRSLRNVGSEKCDTATFIDLTFRSRHITFSNGVIARLWKSPQPPLEYGVP
jgi:hypothetical protein